MIRGDDRYGGLARVIRFVTPIHLPHADVVATLDRKRNLLLVNQELFDGLTRLQQRRVLMTHDAITEVATTRPVFA